MGHARRAPGDERSRMEHGDIGSSDVGWWGRCGMVRSAGMDQDLGPASHPAGFTPQRD